MARQSGQTKYLQDRKCTKAKQSPIVNRQQLCPDPFDPYTVPLTRNSKQANAVDTKKDENLDTTQRPVRYQLVILTANWKCANLTEEQCKTLNIFSCYCCDNYRREKHISLKGCSQDEVNSKTYGCRREDSIKVRVIWSSKRRIKKSCNFRKQKK